MARQILHQDAEEFSGQDPGFKEAPVERALEALDDLIKSGEARTWYDRFSTAMVYGVIPDFDLNLQRTCEAAIDLAMHLVRTHGLGLPQRSRDAFQLLQEADILGPEDTKAMQAMVGFRNVAVHNYQELNLEIVRSIVENHLNDFRNFTQAAIKTQRD